MRLARDLYGKSYSELLAFFFELYGSGQLTAREIFHWDLLGMASKEEVFRSVVSKSALIALQQRLNPGSASAMTEDKALFHRYCRACGLPTPRLLAVIGPDFGWTAEDRIIRHDGQWAEYLDGLPEGGIVIKPSFGVYGRAVRFFRHEAGLWFDDSARATTAAEIVAALRADREFSSFLVQERATPHPDLIRLSGTDYLQTLRIVTVVPEGRGAEVLGSVFKIIGGKATIDNFAGGATGNMVAPVDLVTGKVQRALRRRPGSIGLEAVARHPVTGAALPGFEVPLWEEACNLARRAAMAFLPLLTVGWDIAVSPEGPLLVEGNAWWDPHNEDGTMRDFRTYVRCLLNDPTLH